MSSLTYLMQNKDLEAVFESVFIDSCKDLINMLDENEMNFVGEYVGLLEQKKVKVSSEVELSETLIPILENNAALYGTFLFEGDEVQLTEEEVKTFLETVRNHFGREFIIEALSDAAKQRLKTGAKVGAGLAAAGGAAYGLYRAGKGEDGKFSGENLKNTAGNLIRKGKGLFTKSPADSNTRGWGGNYPGSMEPEPKIPGPRNLVGAPDRALGHSNPDTTSKFPKFSGQDNMGQAERGMGLVKHTAGERPNTTLLPKDVGIKRQIITDRPDTTSKFPKPSGQVSHKDIGGTLSHKDIGGTQMDQNRPTKSSLFGK